MLKNRDFYLTLQVTFKASLSTVPDNRQRRRQMEARWILERWDKRKRNIPETTRTHTYGGRGWADRYSHSTHTHTIQQHKVEDEEEEEASYICFVELFRMRHADYCLCFTSVTECWFVFLLFSICVCVCEVKLPDYLIFIEWKMHNPARSLYLVLTLRWTKLH